MEKKTMTRIKEEDLKKLRIIKAEKNLKTIAEAVSYVIGKYNDKK